MNKKLRDILLVTSLICASVGITNMIDPKETWVGFFIAMGTYIVLHSLLKLLRVLP